MGIPFAPSASRARSIELDRIWLGLAAQGLILGKVASNSTLASERFALGYDFCIPINFNTPRSSLEQSPKERDERSNSCHHTRQGWLPTLS